MKKIKLLPSILMLVLCIGILAVGIYAATPVSYTISGTISISAAVPEVEITGYVDFYNKSFEATETRKGVDWDLTENDLKINLAGATEDTIQYSYKLLRMVIKNNSSVGIGAYFFKSGTTLGDYAELENIMLSSSIYALGEDGNATTEVIADVKYSSYTYIHPNTSVNMFIKITPQFIYESKEGSLDVTLNIEPYKANVEETTMGSATGFVKAPVELSGGDMEHSIGGEIVCVPQTDYCTAKLTGAVRGVNLEFTITPSMYAGGVGIENATNFEALGYYFDSINGSVTGAASEFKINNGSTWDDYSKTYFSNTPTEVGVYYGGFWILGEGITFTFLYDAGTCPDAIKAIAGSSCASLPTSIAGGDYVTTHNVKWIMQSTGEEVTSIAVKETTEIYIAVKTAV